MDRKFLRDLGIENDLIKTILDEHQAVVEPIRQSLKTANADLTTANEKLAKVPTDTGSEWKTKYDTLKTEFDTLDTNYQTSNSALTTFKKNAIANQLLKEGVNPQVADLLQNKIIADTDINTIEFDGATIKNWETISATVKLDYKDLFGTVKVDGIDPGNPPGDGSGKTDWQAMLSKARESGNTLEATKIITQAFAEDGKVLI